MVIAAISYLYYHTHLSCYLFAAKIGCSDTSDGSIVYLVTDYAVALTKFLILFHLIAALICLLSSVCQPEASTSAKKSQHDPLLNTSFRIIQCLKDCTQRLLSSGDKLINVYASSLCLLFVASTAV